jgi:drug/metabolite transporter (DMT)-like permease
VGSEAICDIKIAILMTALILFILSSSSLFVVFRGLGKHFDPLQVILWNYFFCTMLSFLFSWMDNGIHASCFASDWFWPAIGLGALFLFNFSLTEQSVRNMGLSVSSVASKLSLILPFFFSLYISGASPGIMSWAGLLLCLAAIILSSLKPESNKNEVAFSWKWLLPAGIFLGTGFTDILTQWLNQNLVPPSESAVFVLFVFLGAFLAALILTFFRRWRNELQFKFNHILPGFLLGLPNFISYKSILAALDAFQHQGNVVFPIANLGVIILSSMVSFLYFRDPFTRWNLAGIGLACLALFMLYQG